jgi:hypothetical protein
MPNHLIFSGNIIGGNDGYRMLIVAVVNQAIVDYRDCSHHMSVAKRAYAKGWLLRHGSAWLEAVGIQVDQQWWESWINNSCKKPVFFPHSIVK